MTQSHYVSLESIQGIPQAWVARVGYNGDFLTLNTKARMTQPGDIQANNLGENYLIGLKISTLKSSEQ
jgi:hypothetical protein